MFASYHLHRDREIVMAAVNQNGQKIQFESDDLKIDRDIVMTAVN